MRDSGIRLRPGRPADARPFLDLWDEAVAWGVARGSSQQWGAEPASADPHNRERVAGWTQGPGLTVAVSADDDEVLGVCVVIEDHPDYAAPIEQRELYLLLLIVSRRHSGQDIGGQLIRHAADEARAAGAEVLRLDCWADAPTLVAYYERQGFVRSDTFSIGDWHGVIFELPLV
jgi:ribosomal protein S18 acetylase RimI-like enzyme